MKPKVYFMLSGVIFLAVAAMHLARLLSGWEVVLGQFNLPMWGSVLGLLLSGYLSFEGFRLGKK